MQPVQEGGMLFTGISLVTHTNESCHLHLFKSANVSNSDDSSACQAIRNTLAVILQEDRIVETPLLVYYFSNGPKVQN